MKDLIAKLQMDANCALGAIWMHIDAREKRIAELEAQIADWAGLVCGKDGEIYSLRQQLAVASAHQAADTDKVREAILAIGHVADYCDPHKQFAYSSGFDAALKAAAELAASTALQAPVREVPGYKLVPVAITEAMHVAAVKAIIRSTGNDDCPPNVWRAMLAAAPLPVAPVQQEPKP